MSVDTGGRLSTAAQFFLDDEVEESTEAAVQKPTHETVVELLNSASLAMNDASKVSALKKVQELIIYKDPNLLDNFLDEMLGFQSDKGIEVKKFVVGFIEAACKIDNEVLPKVMANLRIMLSDEAVAVRKRVIQAATQIYKVILKWLFTEKTITSIMESTWVYMTQMKSEILMMLDSDNDGIRTNAIKFMEALVLVQTYPESEGNNSKSTKEVSIQDIPSDFALFSEEDMEVEAKQIFDSLVVFHGSPHISSVNLMACMGSLCVIAKQRPELFMSKVVQALEALHVNLPPTLAKSQVSSVRKSLKMHLLSLLKSPSSSEYHILITTLLTDLGATQQEVSKILPKSEEIVRKRTKTLEKQPVAPKKMKTEATDDAKETEEQFGMSKKAHNTAIDITAEKLYPALHTENVTNAVIESMDKLPVVMPPHFQASYTPIAAAGTEGQKRHLARLIATQLTAAGIGPGVEEMARVSKEQFEAQEAAKQLDLPPQSIKTIVGGYTPKEEVNASSEKFVMLMPSGISTSKRLGMKQLDLKSLTKPLPADILQTMTHSAVYRILKAEDSACLDGTAKIRTKILSTLMTYYDEGTADLLMSFILEDLRNRIDLAFSWLYEEYVVYHGFISVSIKREKSLDAYDRCFKKLVQGLIYKTEAKDQEMVFSRLLLEAPCLTGSAVEVIKDFCESEQHVALGLATLKELVVRRPSKQTDFIKIALQLTTHDNVDIRIKSLELVQQLHSREELKVIIEEHAIRFLKSLLKTDPPMEELNPSTVKKYLADQKWSDEIAKLFLQLYLVLLPCNHKLIHDLSTVYVTAAADLKRTILRVLETPVKGMGMDSPELLLLVENCPKGAETLVTRIIHILTDKTPPSSALVARVRDLYQKRVSDVRFLIPVLNGLTKKEVIAALPKLIKLNPVVVKEVFNRLLGGHGDSSWSSPLTPAELLIALHNIDTTKCDMKTIIKATSLCFAEKPVYTQEVLAIVMQQLMEQDPLPTLLMRTVIQSMSSYPRLIGFVMNILQRLIIKQVWKQKKVWEGFIKCCQRTQPQSFQVLLQLPVAQLENVLEASPDIKLPLIQHVDAFTEHQKSHIPQGIMEVLQKNAEPQIPPPIFIPRTPDNQIKAIGTVLSNTTASNNASEVAETETREEMVDPPPPGLES